MLVHSVRLYSLFLPILPPYFILFVFLWSMLGLYIRIAGLYKFGIEHLLTYRTKYPQNQEAHSPGPLRQTTFSLLNHFLTTAIPPFFSFPYFFLFSSLFLVFGLLFLVLCFKICFSLQWSFCFILFCSSSFFFYFLVSDLFGIVQGIFYLGCD